MDGQKSFLYMIDLRPIPMMFVRDYPTDDGKGVERIQVVGTLEIGALDNIEKLKRFISNVVRGQSTVSVTASAALSACA